MIYEIFNAVNGETQGYRVGLQRAKETVERCDRVHVAGFVADYLPAKEGWYVVDMHDRVTTRRDGKPFESQRDADNFADYENQANDNNSFRSYRQEV